MPQNSQFWDELILGDSYIFSARGTVIHGLDWLGYSQNYHCIDPWPLVPG